MHEFAPYPGAPIPVAYVAYTIESVTETRGYVLRQIEPINNIFQLRLCRLLLRKISQTTVY